MIDLCLQFLSSAFPEKLKLHPYWMVGLGIVGQVFVLYGAISWVFGGRKEPVGAPSVPSSAPTATASFGAVTIAPVFNNQTETKMAVNGELLDGTKLVQSAAPPVERPKPNLISHGIHKVVQAGHNFVFDTKNGDVIYTLRVENSVRGAIIQGAMASIKFIGKDGLLGMVETAYWYGEQPNEVEFPLNKTRRIVLGRCANGCWYYFNNFMRHLPQFGRDHDTEPDPPESFALDDICTMKVEVFNPYRGNDIYLEQSFVISPTATDCTILEGS
jgi:hypothetical protein